MSAQPGRLSPVDRYRTDPTFRTIVDVLRSLLHKGETTPTELREALILALQIHEATVRKTYIIHPDGSMEVIRDDGRPEAGPFIRPSRGKW